MRGLLDAVLATWALVVAGDADCPTAAEVARRAQALGVDTTSVGAQEGRVDVQRLADQVVLRLTGPGGEVIAERPLPGNAACGDLAAAAAVVVASWEGELRASGALWLPERPPPPPPVTPRSRYGLGVAGLVVPGPWAPAGRLELERAPSLSGWVWRLGVQGVGPRRFALGLGEARWWRLGVGGAVGWRWGVRALAVEPELEAGVSRLALRGEGQPVDIASTAWDPYARWGARLGLRLRAFQPWVGVFLTAHPVRRTLSLRNSDAERELPTLEIFTGLGVTAWLP